MTQSELAQRAGTRQSAISAYENGRRDPTITMLERLLNASGHHLQIDLLPQSSETNGLPNTPLGRRVESQRAAICAAVEKRGGSRVFVFGSVARGDDDSDSDLDLLVELPERTGILTIGAIARDVERILGVDVDVVPMSTLNPETRRRMVSDAVEL